MPTVCKKTKSIKYKKYDVKILNASIQAYPDTGAYTSSIPKSIISSRLVSFMECL